MATDTRNPMLSVVVCTFNRSRLLARCLESLACQDAPREQFEVIIVDNGSTDTTMAVINDFLTRGEQFRSMPEERQGLSFARNRGWHEACGQYVAYIDDDAIASPDWITEILRFIARQPAIRIFGGPYAAFYLVPVPAWFPPEYGVFDQGDQERAIDLGAEWISGTNMIIRKDLFIRHGGFDVRLGMAGTKALYGEEVNFLLAMRDKGYPIFYVPSIRVAHLVAAYKMSLNWLLLSGYAVGRRYELTFHVNRSLLSHLLSLAGELGRSMFRLFQPVNIPLKRRLYYAFYRVYYEAGAVVEHLSRH